MIESVGFCSTLKDRGFRLFAAVPCSFFKGVVNVLLDDPDVYYVPAANEGAALAVAAGGALAGTRSVVLLQNSGLGNLINPLASRSIPFALPCLLIVSWRGCPDLPADEPQHAVMGASTPALFHELGVSHWTLPDDPDELPSIMDAADREMDKTGRPVALLLRKGVLSDGPGRYPAATSYPLRRGAVLRQVLDRLTDDDAIISTTGITSRELFAIRDRPANFYMQGSMGHAIAIALGCAISQPDRRFVVFDGDGAALMHLGTQSTVGACAPPNLVHIVVDNESYDSTGDQDTTADHTDLAGVARACGYRQVHRCTDRASLHTATTAALSGPGPTFLHVKVAREHATAPPRVTSARSPTEVARRFTDRITEAEAS